MAELSLKHIYKVYGGGVKAVNDFCMNAKDGEFVVLVGPSGCGKSTTLRMIAGLEEVTSGTIMLDSDVINYEEPKNRPIAMVFQNYALYPHLTVYENLAFGLKTGKYSREEIDKRVRAAAETLDLTVFLDRKPNALSGGQMQRVALGRALVKNAKIVLLDEPLSNLDAKLRAKMRVELTGLHRMMKNIFVYVTHDQVEAMTMATKIVVMNGGFIQQTGTPLQVYYDPVNKFVASFIGSPAMKFFPVKILREGDSFSVFANGNKGKITASEMASMGENYYGKENCAEIGVRAKNVRIVEENGALFPAEIPVKAKVTAIEKLGSEKLVHANFDISCEENKIDEDDDITASVRMDKKVSVGDVCTFAVDCRHVNFFDCATEKNICPEFPESKTVRGELKNGRLSILGSEISLPPAIAAQTKDYDGEVFVSIPVSAVISGNIFSGKVEFVRRSEEKRLCGIRAGESYIFSCGDYTAGTRVNYSLDLKSLTIFNPENRVLAAPLTEENTLSGKFLRDTSGETDDYRNIIEGYKMPFDFALSAALIKSKGKEIFKTELGYSFSPYAVSLQSDGIEGEYLCTLDYGAERFGKFSVNGKTVVAKLKNDSCVSGEKYNLLPDVKKLRIFDLKNNIELV